MNATAFPFELASITPAELRAAVAARIETHADAMETLLALLDHIDGEADQEDDGTAEPWLGWTKTGATGNRLDLEELHHDEAEL